VLAEGLEKALASGQAVSIREIQVAPADRVVSAVFQPIPGAGSVLVHAVDVTDEVMGRRRAEALASVSAAFSGSLTVQQVAQALIGPAHEALGASASLAFSLSEGSRPELHLLEARGVEEESLANWRRMPIDAPAPSATCLRTGKAIWIESREAFLEAFPALASAKISGGEVHALIALPFLADQKTLGGISFAFNRARRFSPDERSFIETLSRQVVPAFERAQLFEAAQQSAKTQEFLSAASKDLSTSLDYEATLRRIAQLAVPTLGDWCAVDLLDDAGALNRLAVAHPDPEKIALVHELHQRYPPDLSQPYGVGQVLRSGEPDMMEEIPDELLVQSTRDPDHLRIARSLGLRSYLVVPLKGRERVLGAMTLVSAESGRRYTQRDVHTMVELASRAAMAIENARLFAQVRSLNEGLEQRVRERTEALEEANRELESFSYSVSHDLRAPLRHIAGFTQLLAKKLPAEVMDETLRSYVDAINEAAVEGGKLVDELLSFSRMGRQEIRRSHVNLTELLDEVRRYTAEEAAGRTIEWKISSLPDVQADPAMLRLVLRNLLSNAVKYTRPVERPVIEVSAVVTPAEVQLSVRDNGVGFDMRYVHKLFGVFQRLHTAEQFEGTGIGLANVRRIVLRHGGRVWAEGAIGQGAAFHLTLPRADLT
jgi:signal transduction histidine kinase